MTRGTGTIRDHVRLVEIVLLMTFGAGAIDPLERGGAFSNPIVQDLKKPDGGPAELLVSRSAT